MKITEVNMNIIAVPQGWYIAHAISADLNFKVGLPALMDRTFNLKDRLEKYYDEEEEIKPGFTYPLGNIFSLVVKKNSFDAPDEEALMDALVGLRDSVEEEFVTKLAMPKICSGRKGLPWENVLEMIEFVFADADIDILICVQ